jgi:hypothetical protein
VGKRQAVRVSLEKGMAAFAWTGGAAGIVDAPEDPATGMLEPAGGTLVVVNRTREQALCVLRPVAAPPAVNLSEGSGFEGVSEAGSSLSFAVRPSRQASLLYLWGQPLSVRFLSEEDGRISSGERVPGELAGVLRFPAGRGRLEVQASGDPLKVWLAGRDTFRAVFTGRDPKGKRVALPPEGGQLTQTGQSWSFSLDAPSIVSVRAGGDGVSGLFDSAGACLRAVGGTGGRTLLAMLPKGSYSVFTRPLAGTAGQSGLVRMSRLAPVELGADGPGEPQLLGPQDAALYRFRLQGGGKIGCGIRVQSDGLAASLYSERLSLLGTGRIFVRTLKAGLYYLLVSSSGDTQRFIPLIYGLAGNRSEIPDDVIRVYRGE